MDIKKYRVLLSAFELKSLTEVAEKYGNTQGGISHIIKDIESTLGVSLLNRGKKGVSPTEEGEKLIPLIKSIIKNEDALFENAKQLSATVSGTISIATFTSVGTHWLPKIIKNFTALYKDVHFKLFNGDYADIENWIQTKAVDLAFVALPLSLKCKTIPLYKDELLAILPPTHRLVKNDSCDIKDIVGDDFITLLESSNHDFRRVMDNTGLKLNVKYTTKDDYAIMAMVRQSLGVSIMPSLILKNNTEGIVVKHLSNRVYRTIALALVKDETTPLINTFCDFIQKNIKEIIA